MIRLRVNPSAIEPDALAPAVAALRRGGVVAFPTETFYGLAADPRSARAVQTVFSLKARAPDQPLPLIAADVAQVADHVGTMTPLAARLASRGWPGALTLIIPASTRLCEDVHLSTGTVAVRVPLDAVARS
ncbi:MAG: threonylcarbamoyl-AMP synthase, partial [Acidobacteria bacterium]